MAHDIDPVSEGVPDDEVPADATGNRVVAGTAPAIYLATAYRWGETNNHWYFVYGGTDRVKALALARVERDDRGGKYATCVWEFTADGCDYKLLDYFPSSAETGETNEPRHNHMLDYFGRLGFFLHEAASGKCLQPDPEDPKRLTYQDAEIPEYQRKKVEHEKMILKAFHDTESEAGVKQGAQT